LYEFPTQILDLKNLTDLDIEYNNLTEIPLAVQDLPKLQLFTFDGNPINFEAPENRGLVETIYRMQQNGVICKPDVSMEIAEEDVLMENDQ